MSNQTPLSDYNIQFAATDGSHLNLPNPFRGTLIVGATGSGKTASLAVPITEQFAHKNFAGLVYYSAATLSTKGLIDAMGLVEPRPPKEVISQRRALDFYDVSSSEKVNPLHPQLIDSVEAAQEVAANLLASLGPAADRSASAWGAFFTKTCESYLAGIIWFYRQHAPALCTLPHLIATVAYYDFPHVLSMLSQDKDCQTLVQSLITPFEQDQDKQVVGILSSLQVETVELLTPELCWVLCPDETKGEGFSLKLNDPASPTLLTIGNDPTRPQHQRTAYSAVISCVIGQAIRQMNRANLHHSCVLLDDAETVHLPNLAVLAATARSSRVALVYITQDMAGPIASYGEGKASVLVSNLNNQFFGKITSLESCKLLTRIVGLEESTSSEAVGSVKDAYSLRPGEFMGQIVELKAPLFRRNLLPPAGELEVPTEPVDVPEALAQQMAAKLLAVRQQVADAVSSYPNPLSKQNRYGKRP